MDFPVSRQLKVFFSSLLLQASWSFAGLQSLGFIYSLKSGSKKMNVKRHTDCFNTHPYFATFIIGAVLGIEEAKKRALTEHLRRSKAALESAFASVGDLLFWNLLRPALALIAVILTLKLGLIGPIFFLAAYNIVHIYTRLKGISEGYKKKTEVIDILKNPVIWKLINSLEVVGLFATGLLFGIFLPSSNFNLTIFMVALTGISILWIVRQRPIQVLFLIILIIIIIKGVV